MEATWYSETKKMFPHCAPGTRVRRHHVPVQTIVEGCNRLAAHVNDLVTISLIASYEHIFNTCAAFGIPDIADADAECNTDASHGQPCSHAHTNTFRRSCSAAPAHVHSSH